MIRVLIADDHTLFRRGLISLLGESGEFHVVGEATSGPEAAQLAAELRPDVILMDVHMPGGGGVEAVKRLGESQPATPVIMLTVSERDEDLISAIRVGARGYFLKNAESADLYAAIRQVVSGQAVIDPTLTDKLFHHVAVSPQTGGEPPLTIRELEILQLVAEGCTNREIALRLHVSENTIKTHIARMLEKLDMPNRNDAVALARARGWLPAR